MAKPHRSREYVHPYTIRGLVGVKLFLGKNLLKYACPFLPYDAFGKTQSGLGLTLANAAATTWLFAGDGQYDPANGLTNHIARWRQGHRFLSLDPFSGNINDPQSLHKYLYANANPVSFVDPSGLFSLVGISVGSSIGATLNSLTAEVGAQVLSTFSGSFVAVDPFGLALQAAIYLIPNDVKEATRRFFSGIEWGFVGKIAGATAAVGATALGVKIGLNQIRGIKAAQAVASQVDMLAQLARISKFPDLAQGGIAISRKEAIGIARFEQVTGVIASGATHAGTDFTAPGIWKNVSLKGPLLSTTGARVPITSDRIQGLLTAVSRTNTAADSIVVDLLGFSRDQATRFMSDVNALGITKPVLFINP